MAASQTRVTSFILQAHFDEGAVVIYDGVPRKSVALEWQKDLFRFLPKGQGDIKCQHVYSSFFYATLIQPLSSKNAHFHLLVLKKSVTL